MKYNRILLKLSGEALVGDKAGGIDPEICLKQKQKKKKNKYHGKSYCC